MKLRRRVLPLLLLAASPSPARAVTAQMDRHLQTALDAVYEMHFSSAEAEIQQVIKEEPEHPYGYFGFAVVSMIQYVYGVEQSDPSLLKTFAERTDAAVSKGEAWTAAHPRDPEGYMALGAALGVYSRLLATRHDWLRAYWYGRKAVGYLKKASELDPEMGDPWMGLGMYDYYTDAYPRFVRVLAKLFLFGNRERGIEELKRSAAKGRFTPIASKMLLVEIYLDDAWGLRDPAEAARLSAEIRRRYPDSPMVQHIDFIARYEAGDLPGLLSELQAYNERARQGACDAFMLAKTFVIQGTALWAMNRLPDALEAFRAAAALRARGQVTRWGVWADIRMANLLDLMGKREDAVAVYKTVVSLPDEWDLRQFAKAGLARRWDAPHPGHISPFGS